MNSDALNRKLRELDVALQSKNWGLCPQPRYWNSFWLELERKVRAVESELLLAKPLILSGWSASDHKKRRRFLEQLLTASVYGFTSWAEEYLSDLPKDAWYSPIYEFSFPQQTRPIFYFTGRGGSLHSGFVDSLDDRCIDFDGREINGSFLRQDHRTQVDLIGQDLKHYSERIFIANSYGGYLLISYLIDHAIEIDHLMLISPITGSSTLDGTFFRPAGARAVERAITECDFQGSIKNLSIVVGQDDRQCDPERCQLLAAAFKGRATLIAHQGHRIAPSKVAVELDRFLATC